MAVRLYDPTGSSVTGEELGLAPRPTTLHGLRVGLLHNRKRNAAGILEAVGNELARKHDMTITARHDKPVSTLVPDTTISELRSTCDVVITGVGD